MPAADPLVTTDWLEAHLGDPEVRVVDMRGYVITRPVEPGVEEATYRGAPEEYLAGHVPGAVYIDWTADIVDPDDPVPAQVAGPERFAAAMAERGIGAATHVVAVDHRGGQFATRLWWALRYYGHDAVSVLDGGWNQW
ncbi:MAG TPA: rhodanese-like domain-containing protein, partial [Isosphaeraceae bacterium]